MYRIEQVPIETHVWTLEPNFLTQTDSGDFLATFSKIGHTILGVRAAKSYDSVSMLWIGLVQSSGGSFFRCGRKDLVEG